MVRVSDVASVDMRGQFIEGGQQVEYNNTEVTRDRDEPRTGVVMCQALLIFYMKLRCFERGSGGGFLQHSVEYLAFANISTVAFLNPRVIIP